MLQDKAISYDFPVRAARVARTRAPRVRHPEARRRSLSRAVATHSLV